MKGQSMRQCMRGAVDDRKAIYEDWIVHKKWLSITINIPLQKALLLDSSGVCILVIYKLENVQCEVRAFITHSQDTLVQHISKLADQKKLGVMQNFDIGDADYLQ